MPIIDTWIAARQAFPFSEMIAIYVLIRLEKKLELLTTALQLNLKKRY